MTKIYRFFAKGAEILSLVFMSILLLSAFLITSYVDEMSIQAVKLRWDSPLVNLLGLALILLLFAGFLQLAKKNFKLAKKVMLIVVSLWILLAGVLLIFFGRTIPAADPYTVYHVSNLLALGDTSVIHPTQSYLSYYPQQIGLVAFYEPLIRLWNLLPINYEAYHFFKIVYVFLGFVIFYAQYFTVQFLFKSDKADLIYLCIAGLNFPFLMYTSFIYSEIPSFAAASVGLYLFFRMVAATNEANRKQSILFALLSVLFLALSVMLRKNSLILIIAVVIISFLVWIKDCKKYILLLFTVLCIVCSLSILPVTQKVYELRAGNTLSSGVPAMNYFAMGMQDAGRGCGWYNAFNILTYEESGMDTAKSVAVSKAAIAERLEYFRDNPDYAVNFYLQKFLGQWTDGTYACRQATHANFGGRHAIFTSIYEGELGPAFVQYCNIYQIFIYLGGFLFCLGLFTKKMNTFQIDHLSLLVGLITVFGGFLFHMIWEASGRYIFPYGMMLIPFAAKGIEWLLELLDTFRHHK
ncbi:MAG: hypothetical protein IJW63_07435 [Lachnospiraceae bacterium]|nr:hypothetical protein [Lachnospiraceae bacterium]